MAWRAQKAPATLFAFPGIRHLGWPKARTQKIFDGVRWPHARVRIIRTYHSATEVFLAICGDYPELIGILTQTAERLNAISDECLKIISWYSNETPFAGDIDITIFNVNFDSITDSIHELRGSMLRHSHTSDVTKVLRKLGEFDFYSFVKDFEQV